MLRKTSHGDHTLGTLLLQTGCGDLPAGCQQAGRSQPASQAARNHAGGSLPASQRASKHVGGTPDSVRCSRSYHLAPYAPDGCQSLQIVPDCSHFVADRCGDWFRSLLTRMLPGGTREARRAHPKGTQGRPGVPQEGPRWRGAKLRPRGERIRKHRSFASKLAGRSQSMFPKVTCV